MKPEDDIIFLAKDNPSPASQVGHIARYFTKLGEGYILIYYLLFIFFLMLLFFLQRCSAYLIVSLSLSLAFLAGAKYLELFPWGWLELLMLFPCPVCIFLMAQAGFAVVWKRIPGSLMGQEEGDGFSEQNIWK